MNDAGSGTRRSLVPGALLVVLGLGLRLYRIAEYTGFQGDQGIDALAARRLLVEHQLLFEGPATSTGGVHLGPFYYYLLALPMWVDWLDPLADAVLMAVLGAAAVGIVFVLAGRWFGVWPAVAAAGLYAVSPAAIVASRSAWNPAPAPAAVCLALLGLDSAIRTGNGRWLLLVGLALGCVIQFHYFSLAVVLVVMAFTVLLVRAEPSLVPWSLGGLGVFFVLLSPFAVHELVNGLPNVHAAMELARGGTPAATNESAQRRMFELFALRLIGGFLTARMEVLADLMTVALTTGLLVGLTRGLVGGLARGRAARLFPFALIASLLAATVAQGIVYRGPIFEHYLVPISPLLYLAVGAVLGLVACVQGHARAARLAAGLVVLGLAILNVLHSPFNEPPENQLARTWAVAESIVAAAGGEPFALWLMEAGESDSAYRFQLERIGRPAEPDDGLLPAQLFIICPRPACDPALAPADTGPDWADSRLAWETLVADEHILQLVQAR